MRTIRLYGELGKKYGRVHKMEVASVSEAVRALCANFDGFKQDLLDSESRMTAYEVWDGKHNVDPQVDDDFFKNGDKSIKIIPRVHGASNAGKIIAGIVLIAAAFVFAPSAAALFAGKAGFWAGLAFNMGVSLVLSGVIGMMTKTASGTSIDSTSDNTQSYIFSGTQNTTKQGNPVFIAYGTHLLGSQVISSSLTTSNVAI